MPTRTPNSSKSPTLLLTRCSNGEFLHAPVCHIFKFCLPVYLVKGSLLAKRFMLGVSVLNIDHIRDPSAKLFNQSIVNLKDSSSVPKPRAS